MERYNNYIFEAKKNIDRINKIEYYNNIIPISDIDSLDDDIIILSKDGDRYDLLANKYYNDSNLWWIISDINPHLRKDSMYIESGNQILIPKDYNYYLLQFEENNKNRF